MFIKGEKVYFKNSYKGTKLPVNKQYKYEQTGNLFNS